MNREEDRIREQQQKIYEKIHARNMRIREALYFGHNSNDNGYIAKHPSNDSAVRAFMAGFKEMVNSIRIYGR